MNIQNITLMFENQEHRVIAPEHIKHFCLHDIKDTLSYDPNSNTMTTSQTAELMVLRLAAAANTESNSDEHFDEPFYLFERLIKHHDVLVVSLNYGTPDQVDYYMDWDLNGGEYTNTYQTIAKDDDDLIIAVSKNTPAKTFVSPKQHTNNQKGDN